MGFTPGWYLSTGSREDCRYWRFECLKMRILNMMNISDKSNLENVPGCHRAPNGRSFLGRQTDKSLLGVVKTGSKSKQSNWNIEKLTTRAENLNSHFFLDALHSRTAQEEQTSRASPFITLGSVQLIFHCTSSVK